MTVVKAGDRDIPGSTSVFPSKSGNPVVHWALRNLAILCLSSLFLCGFGPPTLTDRDVNPSFRYTMGQLRQVQLARVPPPGISAASAIVFDVDTGRVLMEKEARLPVSPASLAKTDDGRYWSLSRTDCWKALQFKVRILSAGPQSA